jgi:XTP/dITP diphosphohydrolase
MKIIFASNNKHKVEELKDVIPANVHVLSLQEAGIDIDIPEPHPTLEENAREKAKTIYELTHTACFSEDTGLEVSALNGEPGVNSARYAGEEKSFKKNTEKLLEKLKNISDTSAQFRAVMCLIIDGQEHYFQGVCKGRIIREPKGVQGFGYDPVFIPDGAEKTFAEMSIKEKNIYNHRRKAADKLVAFLNNLTK